MTEENQPSTIEIHNLDNFAKLLAYWHQRKIQILEHMTKIPEGSTFEIEGKEVELTGAVHSAFVLGIEIALTELGELPFTVEQEAADAAVN